MPPFSCQKSLSGIQKLSLINGRPGKIKWHLATLCRKKVLTPFALRASSHHEEKQQNRHRNSNRPQQNPSRQAVFTLIALLVQHASTALSHSRYRVRVFRRACELILRCSKSTLGTKTTSKTGETSGQARFSASHMLVGSRVDVI